MLAAWGVLKGSVYAAVLASLATFLCLFALHLSSRSAGPSAPRLAAALRRLPTPPLWAGVALDFFLSATNASAALEYLQFPAEECGGASPLECLRWRYWWSTHMGFTLAHYFASAMPATIVAVAEVLRGTLFVVIVLCVAAQHQALTAALAAGVLGQAGVTFCLAVLGVLLFNPPESTRNQACVALLQGFDPCPRQLLRLRAAVLASLEGVLQASLPASMLASLRSRSVVHAGALAARANPLHMVYTLRYNGESTLTAVMGNLAKFMVACIAITFVSASQTVSHALASAPTDKAACADGQPAEGPSSALEHGGSASPQLLPAEVQVAELIGRGGFATVHAGLWNGTRVALKVWTRAEGRAAGGASHSASALRQLRREVALLCRLRHPNVLTVYGFVQGEHSMSMVMTLGANGSLWDVLRASAAAQSGLSADSGGLEAARGTKDNDLGWGCRLRIASGIAAGMEFLHGQRPPIFHRDLKCANIVMDERLAPQVADFGLSSSVTETLRAEARPAAACGTAHEGTGAAGTLRYLAPEALLLWSAQGAAAGGGGCGDDSSAAQQQAGLEAVDAYAMGCLLFELAHIGTGPGSRNPLGSAGGGGGHGAKANDRPELPQTGSETSGSWWGGGDVLLMGGGASTDYSDALRRLDSSFTFPIQAHVPAALGTAILRCTAFRPSQRPGFQLLREELMAAAAAARCD